MTVPLQLSKNYISLDIRQPKAPKEVRSYTERLAYGLETGEGKYAFLRSSSYKKVRMIELLGKGDVRVGNELIHKQFKKTELAFVTMVKDIQKHRRGTEFSLYIGRSASYVAYIASDIGKENGLNSYRNLRTARMLLKRYERFKEERK